MDGVQLQVDIQLERGEFLVNLRGSSNDGFVYPHQHRTRVDGLVSRLGFGGTKGKFIVFATLDHEVDDVQDVIVHGEKSTVVGVRGHDGAEDGLEHQHRGDKPLVGINEGYHFGEVPDCCVFSVDV